MLWGLPLLVLVLLGPFRCDVVRITNSLAGMVWAHAEQAPLLPNSLQLKGGPKNGSNVINILLFEQI